MVENPNPDLPCAVGKPRAGSDMPILGLSQEGNHLIADSKREWRVSELAEAIILLFQR